MRDTSEARRRRAEKQLRDRNGRWIEMGGNAKWTSPSGKQYSGSFIGVDSSGYALVLPPIKNPTHRPQPYRVPLKSVEMVRGKARINRKDGSTNRANEAYKNEMMDRVSENPDTSSATNAYRNEVSKAKEHFDKTGEYIGPGPNRDSEKLNRVREGYYNSTEDLRETIKNGGDPKDFSATMHDDDGNLIRLSAKRNAKGETILEARVADSRTVVHSEVFDPESDGEETSNQIYDLFDGLIEDPEEYDFERAQNNAPESEDEDENEEPAQDDLDPEGTESTEDEDPIEEVDPDNEFDRDVAGDPIGSEVEDAQGDVYRKVADDTWEINGDDTDTISDDEVTQTGVRERVASQEQEQTPTTEDSEDSEEEGEGWDAADQENGTTIWDEFGNRYEKESDNTWRVYSGNDGQELDERETDDQVNDLGEVFFGDPRDSDEDEPSSDTEDTEEPSDEEFKSSIWNKTRRGRPVNDEELEFLDRYFNASDLNEDERNALVFVREGLSRGRNYRGEDTASKHIQIMKRMLGQDSEEVDSSTDTEIQDQETPEEPAQTDQDDSDTTDELEPSDEEQDDTDPEEDRIRESLYSSDNQVEAGVKYSGRDGDGVQEVSREDYDSQDSTTYYRGENNPDRFYDSQLGNGGPGMGIYITDDRSEAGRFGSSVIETKLRDDARVATAEDLDRDIDAMEDGVAKDFISTITPTAQAAFLGYDALDTSTEGSEFRRGNIAVVNPSALITPERQEEGRDSDTETETETEAEVPDNEPDTTSDEQNTDSDSEDQVTPDTEDEDSETPTDSDDNEESTDPVQEEFDFTQEALDSRQRELEETTQEALESGRPLDFFERIEAMRYRESRRLTTDEQEELGRLLRDNSDISADDSDRRDALLKKAEGDTRPQWLINMERDRDTIGIRLGEQDPSLPRRDTSDRDLEDGEDDNIQGEFDLFADDNNESSTKTSNVDGASRNTAGLKEYPVGQEFVTDDSADTVLYKSGDDEFEEYSADSEGGEYTPTGKVSTAQEVIDEKKDITSTGTYSSPSRMPRKKREAWERIPNRFVENHTPDSLKLTKSQRDRYNASEDEKERRDILKKRLYQLRKLGQDPDRLGRDIRKLELRLEGYDSNRAHTKSARRSFERATKALEDGNYSKARSELESAGTALRGKRRDRSVQEAAENRPELLDVAPNNIRSIFNLPPKPRGWRPDPDEISGSTKDRIEDFIRLSQDARQNSTTRTNSRLTTDSEGRDISSDFIESAIEESGYDEDFVGVFTDGTPIFVGDKVLYWKGYETEEYRGANALRKLHPMIVTGRKSNGVITMQSQENDGVVEYYSGPGKKERAEGKTKGQLRTADTAVKHMDGNASKIYKVDNPDINGVDDRSAVGVNRQATRTNAHEVFTRDGTHIKEGLEVEYRTRRDGYSQLRTATIARVMSAKNGTIEVIEDGKRVSVSPPYMRAKGSTIKGFDGDVPTEEEYKDGVITKKNPDTVSTSIGDIPIELYRRGDFDEFIIRRDGTDEPATAEDAEDGDVYVSPDNAKHIVDGDRVKGYDTETDSILENDDQDKGEYFEKNPDAVVTTNRKDKAKRDRTGYTAGPANYFKSARGFKDSEGRERTAQEVTRELNRAFFQENPEMARRQPELMTLNTRLNNLPRDAKIRVEGEEDGLSWVRRHGLWVQIDGKGESTGLVRTNINFAGKKLRAEKGA